MSDDEEEQLDHESAPQSFKAARKPSKPAKQRSKGVVYISRIPPHLASVSQRQSPYVTRHRWNPPWLDASGGDSATEAERMLWVSNVPASFAGIGCCIISATRSIERACKLLCLNAWLVTEPC